MLIYICEDVKTDQMRLLHHLEKYRHTLEKQYGIVSFDVKVFENGNDLLAAWEYQGEKPDLLFLDIYMSGKDGIETARILREKGCTAGIIFTTSSREHIMESYDTDALYYLQKPYTAENFLAAMKKCEGIFRSQASVFQATVRGKETQIPFPDILYFESDGHYVIVHEKDGGAPRFRLSMNEAAEQAGKIPGFLPCGKSYIVNLNETSGLEDRTLTMTDGSQIPVPVRAEKDVRTALEEWKDAH